MYLYLYKVSKFPYHRMKAELFVKREMKRCKLRQVQNVDWTYLSGYISVEGRSKIGNEVSVSVKDGEFLTILVATPFLKINLFHKCITCRMREGFFTIFMLFLHIN